MFGRLRNRFLLLNMAITSLVVVAAFLALSLTAYANTRRSNQNKLESLATSAMAMPALPMATSMEPTILAGGARLVSPDYVQSFTLLLNASEDMLFRVASIIDLPMDVYQQAADWYQAHPTSTAPVKLAGRYWQFAATDQVNILIQQGENGTMSAMQSTGYAQVDFLDVTDSLTTLRNTLLSFVPIGLATLAAVFVVSWVFAGRAIRPVSEAWERQQRFIADASHELKTPLAILQSNLDALTASPEETIASQSKWTQRLREGCDRMSQLVSNLLTLARADATSARALVRVDVAEVVRASICAMEALARRRDLRIQAELDADIAARADAEALRQALCVLIDNAIKYARDGAVRVRAERRRGRVAIAVENDGPGIPDADIARIFDRFYRADASRAEGGFGLGLPIARSVVEGMGGRIHARSAPGATAFEIELEAWRGEHARGPARDART